MKKIEEFWYCVSNQEQLPIYKFEEINSNQTCTMLIDFINEYHKQSSTQKNINSQQIISDILLEKPVYLNEIRKLIGISDKRLYLELSYIFNRYTTPSGKNIFNEKRTSLKKHTVTFFINALKHNKYKSEIANIISRYFIDKDLLDILNIFSQFNEEDVTKLFKFLIVPKELQQKEAKYRGHGAELEVAKIFSACNQIVYPPQKSVNPMESRDPNVDLSTMTIIDRDSSDNNIHSFDIIILDENNNIRILVQSLIHSSDPGQYGVNKSSETVTIKNLIDKYNLSHPTKPHVYLLGSVDGVGFIENPNGTIAKMLDCFDYFIQINTTFKIGLILYQLGLMPNLKGVYLDNSFFDNEMMMHFTSLIQICGLKVIDKAELHNYTCISAGKGILCVEQKRTLIALTIIITVSRQLLIVVFFIL